MSRISLLNADIRQTHGVAYTIEDAHIHSLGLKGEESDSLKTLFLRCKRMPEILDVEGAFSGNLDEDFMVRSLYAQNQPLGIYKIDGIDLAYIGDYLGSNWGDSVIFSKEALIDSYTDLAANCPILIMRLKDENGKESTQMTHVHTDHIDAEVANLIYRLRDERGLSPKEIIFSPRGDSRYYSALNDLQTFGTSIGVEVIRRTKTARALVSSKGWCIYKDCSKLNPSLNSLIAGRLWKKD